MPRKEPKWKIVVSVPSQEALVYCEGRLLARFAISTSRYGLGTLEGSFCTPLGRFRIAEKIGDGAPAWAVFRGRIPTGEIALPGGEEDLVLTRIFWLEGLDAENANTKERYIYFHGTNQESDIGRPASHGCVRLKNDDMIELFNLVPVGAEVEIKADASC
jgi:L,D-transpeptidase YbiS